MSKPEQHTDEQIDFQSEPTLCEQSARESKDADSTLKPAQNIVGQPAVPPSRGTKHASGFHLDQATLAPEDVESQFENALFPQIPGYEILEEIGRGGMGVVYKARQEGLSRLVALKMILAGSQARVKQLQRFREEAEVIAGLDHPGIVQIYEVGQHLEGPWFTLEYIDGGTLAEKVHHNPPDMCSAARVVLKLAEAMDQAHSQGILHRDLKPANVLLAGSREAPLNECEPKITDFGLAKRLEGDSLQTREGAVMGTPSYMPPEQAAGKNWQLGPAADIYSLGAILYDLLTGEPPFKGETASDTLQLVLTSEPRLPSRIRPEVPRDLQVICMKCLEKDPAQRYRSAHELAEDLRSFLNGEPIQARSASFTERAWKWSKRRPAVAALICVSLLSLVGFAIGAAAFAREHALATRREKALREEAERQRQRAEANHRQAQKVVQKLTYLGHRRLKNVPHMEETRVAILEQALQLQEQFLQINGGRPGQRIEVGKAWLRKSEILEMLGKRPEALIAVRKALEIFEILYREQSDNPDVVKHLAASWNDLAILLQATGELEKAEQAHEKALSLKRSLVDTHPTEQHREDLAKSLHHRGHLRQMRGKHQLAEADYEASLKLVKEKAQHLRARAWSGLGALWIQHRPLRAFKALSHSINHWSELLKQSPGDPSHQRELAMAYLNRGTLHHVQKRAEPADADYKQAIEILTELTTKYTKTRDYRELAVNAHTNRAHLKRGLRLPFDAMEDWKHSIEHLQVMVKSHPKESALKEKLALAHNDLAISCVNANQHLRAIEEWGRSEKIQRELIASNPKNAAYWRDLEDTLSNLITLQKAMGAKKELVISERKLVELRQQKRRQLESP